MYVIYWSLEKLHYIKFIYFQYLFDKSSSCKVRYRGITSPEDYREAQSIDHRPRELYDGK